MQEAWLKYLRASGYALRQYKRGPFRYRLQPKSDVRRAAALGWFVTEHDLIAHLQAMAGHDLRRDAQMHMDAAYAVASGDHAFLGEQLGMSHADAFRDSSPGGRPSESHRRHTIHAKECARLFQLPRARDLMHAARLHREFCLGDTAAQYRCRLDQAQAWFDAKALAAVFLTKPYQRRQLLVSLDLVTGV